MGPFKVTDIHPCPFKVTDIHPCQEANLSQLTHLEAGVQGRAARAPASGAEPLQPAQWRSDIEGRRLQGEQLLV